MKIEDLDVEAQQFINIVHDLKEHDRPGYFALASSLFAFVKNGMDDFPDVKAMFESATKGELKKAIKHLRGMRLEDKYQEKIDLVVSYIRNNWINKEAQVG